MRLFFGMILGAALTVAVAYAHDNFWAGKRDANVLNSQGKHLVNWDVAAATWDEVSKQVREQVGKLTTQ